MDRVRMTLRVVNDLNKWLAEEAERRGISKNDVIIMACWDMLKKRKEKDDERFDDEGADD